MRSPSKEVFIKCGEARMDIRTTTGKNLDMMRSETGLNKKVSSVGQVQE